MALSILLAVGSLVGVAGHGLMTLPTPRTLSSRPSTLDRAVIFGDWGNNKWYSNNLGGDAGWLATQGRRMQIKPEHKSSCRRGRNPWCAPGSSDVLSPCGIYGGGLPCDSQESRDRLNSGRRITGASGPCENPLDGRNLSKSPNQVKWRAGGVAKVGWGTQANHGGGVSYRLCPENATQDEACFQSNILKFASNATVIRWVTCPGHKCIRSGQEMVIPLGKVTENTHPAGSEWAANPIGWACPDCTTCAAPRVRQGTYIQGPNCYKLSNHNFSMVDLVQVPNTPGKFTLSMRWDCGVNPQIWNNCADLEIVADDSPEYPDPVEWPVPVEQQYTSHVKFKCPAPNKGIIARMKPDSRWPDERSPYFPRDRFPQELHEQCGRSDTKPKTPTDKDDEEPLPDPKHCCTELTLECQACREGMTVDDYCKDFCVGQGPEHEHCKKCPKPGPKPGDGYILRIPWTQGLASDCRALSCVSYRGDSAGVASCKADCDNNNNCNLLNFIPNGGSGTSRPGRCCLRSCDGLKDLADLKLTGKWRGWDIYVKALKVGDLVRIEGGPADGKLGYIASITNTTFRLGGDDTDYPMDMATKTRLTVGDEVQVVGTDYLGNDYSGSSGTIVQDDNSGSPYKVRMDTGPGSGKDGWFNAGNVLAMNTAVRPSPSPSPLKPEPEPVPAPESETEEEDTTPEPESESETDEEDTTPEPESESEEPGTTPEPEPDAKTCSICPQDNLDATKIAGTDKQGKEYTCHAANEWLNLDSTLLTCEQGAAVWSDACCVGTSPADLLQMDERRNIAPHGALRGSSFMQDESICVRSDLELMEFIPAE